MTSKTKQRAIAPMAIVRGKTVSKNEGNKTENENFSGYGKIIRFLPLQFQQKIWFFSPFSLRFIFFYLRYTIHFCGRCVSIKGFALRIRRPLWVYECSTCVTCTWLLLIVCVAPNFFFCRFKWNDKHDNRWAQKQVLNAVLRNHLQSIVLTYSCRRFLFCLSFRTFFPLNFFVPFIHFVFLASSINATDVFTFFFLSFHFVHPIRLQVGCSISIHIFISKGDEGFCVIVMSKIGILCWLLVAFCVTAPTVRPCSKKIENEVK